MRCGGRIATALVLAGLLVAGCGDSKPRALDPDPAQETSDKPAKLPPGWRTVRNRKAGFTLSIPREWQASTRRGATLIRSGDHLLALTVQADRGSEGRELPPDSYARQTLAALPGFTTKLAPANTGSVDGSPYPNSRTDTVGTLARNKQRQRVSVAVFQRKGRVSYVASAFRNHMLRARGHEEELNEVLASLRAQAPG